MDVRVWPDLSILCCTVLFNKRPCDWQPPLQWPFQLDPLGTAATKRPIVPAPDDYDDGEICGIIGRGNRSTRRKPATKPLCPPQISHAARMRTRAAAVGSQRLTAWATARPFNEPCQLSQRSIVSEFILNRVRTESKKLSNLLLLH
jgi:hypothetical protein